MGAVVCGRMDIVFDVEPVQPLSNAPDGARIRIRLRPLGFAAAFVRTAQGITQHWLFRNDDGTWRLSEPRGINHRI